jgi:rhomboid protease GluP
LNLFIRTENFSDYIRRFPLTATFIALNVAYFIYYKFLFSGPFWTEAWGIFDVSRFADGEWYRMITAIFTHLDFFHLFFNIVSLYLFSSVLEQLISKRKYVAIYIGGGALSYLCVYAFSTVPFVVGASGSIFAVFGALFYLTRKKPHLFDLSSRSTLNVIIFLNIITTFIISNVSISGHIGGIVAGYLSARLLKIEDR